jgi:hypothetical protein
LADYLRGKILKRSAGALGGSAITVDFRVSLSLKPPSQSAQTSC